MKNTTSLTRGHGLLESFLSKKRAQKANSLIIDSKRDGKILDIGCGSYPYFLLNTNFKEKYGIDPSLKVSNLKNIELSKLDFPKSQLPFKDNFFDNITMLAVFEHIERVKLNLVLAEIKRVLKKDGIIVITTPAPWADKILHNMARIGLISSEEIHDHKTHYDMKEIIDLFRQAGYKNENIRSGYFELFMNMWFIVSK